MKHVHLKQQAPIVDYESLIVFWTYFEEKQFLGFPSRKSSIAFLAGKDIPGKQLKFPQSRATE